MPLIPTMLEVTNEELCIEIAESKLRGVPTCKLGELCVSIATRQLYKPGFISSSSYELQQDVLMEGIKQMLISYKAFDPTKNDNAFVYFVIMAHRGFRCVLNKKKMEQIIKDINAQVE
jgi:hypothetical protein